MVEPEREHPQYTAPQLRSATLRSGGAISKGLSLILVPVDEILLLLLELAEDRSEVLAILLGLGPLRCRERALLGRRVDRTCKPEVPGLQLLFGQTADRLLDHVGLTDEILVHKAYQTKHQKSVESKKTTTQNAA